MGPFSAASPLPALFFLSGFASLVYEVAWLRMLDRAFGSTTAATSNVLAIFMIGLAAGGWAASRLTGRLKRPLSAYGVIELALGTTALLSSCALVLLSSALRPAPYLHILTRRLERLIPGGRLSFHHEGRFATVTGYRTPDDKTLLSINGIRVSATGDLGRFMIHLPLLLRPAPKRALVVCLGVGNKLRAAADHRVAVDVVEIEPDVLASFPRIWSDWTAYLSKPGVRTHVNDGRTFFLTSRGAYDMIVVDGSPPISAAGTVNLYTREFVDPAKARLAEGGILALWVPPPCFREDFWMIARNFTDAFGHTAVWLHPDLAGGVLLMGSGSPLAFDAKTLAARARERGLLTTAPWLDGSLLTPEHLVLDAPLRAGAERYPPVSDDQPRTEFPLPRVWRWQPLVERPRFLFAPVERRPRRQLQSPA